MRMKMMRIAERVANKYMMRRFAGPLRDVSHLRYQAVFMMGAGGSGKGYAGYKWMKYLPGEGSGGATRKVLEEREKEQLSEEERSLSNLHFEKAMANIERAGVKVELIEGGNLRFPFRLYTDDGLLDPSDWKDELPPEVFREVEGLKDVVFSAPKHEIPSYWRQVNPDLYKEELAGFIKEKPGYVHQMSSEMAKSYFWTVLETGDPLFVDGTGRDAAKMISMMKAAKKKGYRVTLVLVIVPLTVNLIRNATRPRKVEATKIVEMWWQIKTNFPQIKGIADRFKVIDNRNDSRDVKIYHEFQDQIDNQVRKTYPSYNGLEEVVRREIPGEYREWAKKLGWG